MAGSTLTVGIDPSLTAAVQEYLDEATSGPTRGGIAGELTVAGMLCEAYASRDWGVEFARDVAGAGRVRERLSGAQLTLDDAGVALGKLLRA